jgi:hypothetical protein
MIPEDHAEQEDMYIEEELIHETENAKTFLFFDFECRQDDLVECNTGYKPDVFGKCIHCMKSACGSYEHKPNLCVVHKVCTICMDKEEICENCGQREHVLRGEDTLNEFCQWLFSEEKLSDHGALSQQAMIRTPYYNTCTGTE